MLAALQIEEFQHRGFLNGGRILADGELEELKGELDRILEKEATGFESNEKKPVAVRDLNAGKEVGKNPVWQIVNIWEASPAYERLLYHPFIVKAVSQLTAQANLMIWHDQIQYKPAENGGATRWHQDAPLWPIILPMTPVSAWIPFDDADEENGCMWMVPGSHKWGNQIDFLHTQNHLDQREDFAAITGFTPPAGSAVEEVRAVPWPVKKGEVSFHHSLAWHGSPFNRSERPRRAIAIHYMTGEARFEASGEHPMKQFVELEDGAPMAAAGEHFPHVCRDGEPVDLPEHLGALEF